LYGRYFSIVCRQRKNDTQIQWRRSNFCDPKISTRLAPLEAIAVGATHTRVTREDVRVPHTSVEWVPRAAAAVAVDTRCEENDCGGERKFSTAVAGDVGLDYMGATRYNPSGSAAVVVAGVTSLYGEKSVKTPARGNAYTRCRWVVTNGGVETIYWQYFGVAKMLSSAALTLEKRIDKSLGNNKN